MFTELCLFLSLLKKFEIYWIQCTVLTAKLVLSLALKTKKQKQKHYKKGSLLVQTSFQNDFELRCYFMNVHSNTCIVNKIYITEDKKKNNR